MNGMEHIESHYEMVKTKYSRGVNDRIALWKFRRVTNEWRIYTEKKLKNNAKKTALESWLRVGYSAETISLLKQFRVKSLAKNNRVIDFQNNRIQNKARSFLK
jgi:hypothetical protein